MKMADRKTSDDFDIHVEQTTWPYLTQLIPTTETNREKGLVEGLPAANSSNVKKFTEMNCIKTSIIYSRESTH